MTRNTVLFILALYLSIYTLFPGKVYGIEWMSAAFILFLLLVNGSKYFLNQWNNSSDKDFLNKLFWSSLVIRILAMFVLLAISYNTWNTFYTVGARDEMVYYRVATEAVTIWNEQTINDAYLHIFSSYKNDISDTGFSTFLMFPILIFGQSPITIKIILCVIGSIVVVRGYKIASLLFEENVARLAAIFLMLYPISWFYSAIMLKEGIMVLLITESLIMMVKMQRSFKLHYLLLAMLFIMLLFFFRSAISILLLMVLGFSFFMQYKKKNLLLSIVLAGFAVLIYIYFLKSTGRYDEYYTQYTNINEFTQERLTYMESINPFVALVGSPVFAVMSYISPFPSVVLVPNQLGLPHSEYYYHVAGNLFWIVLAFFSFYGLYYSIRYKRQEMAVLIAFIIGYQFVLLKAMMFTSVRFSYPAKPFLLIMAAYGIYQLRSKKWYPVYLAAAMVLIIVWNYVRLKGRS